MEGVWGGGVVVKSCRRQLYKLGQCFSSITHKKKRFLVTCRLHFWLINVYVYKLPCVHAIILYLYSQVTSMVEILSTTAHLSYGRWIYTFNLICLNLKKPFGCADKVQGFINYVNKIVKKKKRWFKLNKNKMLQRGGIVFGQYLDPIYPPLLY